jgi:hypothetical protein
MKQIYAIIYMLIFTSVLYGADSLAIKANDLLSDIRKGNKSSRHKLSGMNDPELFTIYFKALSDSNDVVRELAVSKMRHYNNTKSIKPLIEILKNDRKEKIRATAALSLGLIGNAKAGPALMAMSNDTNRYISEMSIRALGRLKYEGAIPLLKSKLKGDNEKDWYIQSEAASALYSITGKDWSEGISQTPPEHRIRDEQVSILSANEDIKYLRGPFSDMANKIEAINDNPRYYIGFSNSLLGIEAYILKKEVETDSLKCELIKYKKQNNEASEEDCNNQEVKYNNSKNEYKQFINNFSWGD